jgi:hypothetical protein
VEETLQKAGVLSEDYWLKSEWWDKHSDDLLSVWQIESPGSLDQKKCRLKASISSLFASADQHASA